MITMNEIKVDPVVSTARLVVFVPEMLENITDFARQVYYMALSQQREVFYLALDGRETDELATARQLTTLTAMTQSSAVRVKALQVKTPDRADALRQVTHPGDLVIWPEERLLAPASLENELCIKQYVLPGVYTSAGSQSARWYQAVLFWLTGLIIVSGFSFLEIRFVGLSSGWSGKALLILLFTIEACALYQWNRILG